MTIDATTGEVTYLVSTEAINFEFDVLITATGTLDGETVTQEDTIPDVSVYVTKTCETSVNGLTNSDKVRSFDISETDNY